ncbi:hypothetical protein ACIB24_05180 [Spongisporangium articulatum]|uniref:Membrane protein involved in the export of O-antigen and teichoic acid n=1 Tax=Spongisporangium articulatum TaxID=3362603 RepID=A0ABW8AKD3_9ACTN
MTTTLLPFDPPAETARPAEQTAGLTVVLPRPVSPDRAADSRTDSAGSSGSAGSAGEAPPSGGGRRALWTFADQALSSLTNAVLSVVVALLVSSSDFGAFSLALLTFSFVVGLTRAVVAEPFMVRFSAVDPRTRSGGAGRATGAALSVGLVAGAICLAVAALLDGSARTAYLALALSLPGLCVQDVWRHTFFAAGRPAAAALNDAVWTVLQFAALGWLIVVGTESVFAITLAWGASATAAAVLGVTQSGVRPRLGATWHWLRETRDLNVHLGLGFVLNQGAIQVATYAVAAIVGLAGSGALRGAQVLLGPLNLVFAGFGAFVLPLLARRVAAGQPLLKIAVPCSVVLGLGTSLWVGILVLLPDSLGEKVLGDSWAGASEVMLPSGLVLVALALCLGASNSLVALSRADLMLRITLVQAPLMLGLGLLGAFGWGAAGAAYGFAAAQATGLVIAWLFFLRADGRTAPAAALG